MPQYRAAKSKEVRQAFQPDTSANRLVKSRLDVFVTENVVRSAFRSLARVSGWKA